MSATSDLAVKIAQLHTAIDRYDALPLDGSVDTRRMRAIDVVRIADQLLSDMERWMPFGDREQWAADLVDVAVDRGSELRDARETIARVERERDAIRSNATRLERERDAERADLDMVRSALDAARDENVSLLAEARRERVRALRTEEMANHANDQRMALQATLEKVQRARADLIAAFATIDDDAR